MCVCVLVGEALVSLQWKCSTCNAPQRYMAFGDFVGQGTGATTLEILHVVAFF